MFMSISDAMCDYELLISPQTCLSPWLPPRFHSWVHLEPMAPWTPSATTGPDSECPIRFVAPSPLLPLASHVPPVSAPWSHQGD